MEALADTRGEKVAEQGLNGVAFQSRSFRTDEAAADTHDGRHPGQEQKVACTALGHVGEHRFERISLRHVHGWPWLDDVVRRFWRAAAVIQLANERIELRIREEFLGRGRKTSLTRRGSGSRVRVRG